MQLNIQNNFPAVAQALARLQREVADKVTARALNATVAQARTAMSKAIRDEYAVNTGFLKDRLVVRKASFRNGQVRLTAELIGGDGKKRSANLIHFSARQTGLGVSVKVKKAGSRKLLKGAFIGNSGRTVFKRVGDKRLPIKPGQTVDVPQMFQTKKVNAQVVRLIEEKFPTIFTRELQYALGNFRRGA
ncbi:MAG: phage tail protein [Pseudomonadota bacterium]